MKLSIKVIVAVMALNLTACGLQASAAEDCIQQEQSCYDMKYLWQANRSVTCGWECTNINSPTVANSNVATAPSTNSSTDPVASSNKDSGAPSGPQWSALFNINAPRSFKNCLEYCFGINKNCATCSRGTGFSQTTLQFVCESNNYYNGSDSADKCNNDIISSSLANKICPGSTYSLAQCCCG